MLRIGNVSVDPPLFLAPMAGITDRDFRRIIRRIGGVGMVAMEFLPSKGIVGNWPETLGLMHFVEEERPLAIQIYGSDVETMAEAARRVEDLGPDVCDINMGCPANKVLKGCAGAGLMRDLRLAEEIIRAVRRAVSIPVTVKFRLGIDDRRINFLDLGKICEDQGVAAVAMHARTAKQMFRGQADWSHIARLKDALSIPVLGNGDIRTADDAVAMFAQTGCDGVMIGRGATRNPWLFRQISQRMSGAEAGSVELNDRKTLILDHFRTVIDRDDEMTALHKVRKFTGWYSHGLPEGKTLRRRINDLPTTESFLDAIERFFEKISLEHAA